MNGSLRSVNEYIVGKKKLFWVYEIILSGGLLLFLIFIWYTSCMLVMLALFICSIKPKADILWSLAETVYTLCAVLKFIFYFIVFVKVE